MHLIPPHLLTVPLFIILMLIVEFFEEFGSKKDWYQSMLDGKSSMPAARIGPAFLAFFFVLLFTFIAAIIRLFSVAGIKGFFKGLALGLTFGSLIDVALLNGIARDSVNASIYLYGRLWAGYGAMGALGFCLWVGLINPLLSTFGKHKTDGPGFHGTVSILCLTGPIMAFLSTVIGFLKFTLFGK